MPLKKTSSILVLCSVVLLASSAHAVDTKPEPTAKTLYSEGVDLTNQQKFSEAEAKFLQAWALQKSYDVAANLGEVYMQLDRPADAAVFLTYALSNYPASGKTDKRDWIDKRLKEARSKVVALTLSVNVPGAEVRINGKLAGKAPIEGEVFAAPGDCTVEVSAPEYLPYAQKIKAAAGGTQKVQVELELPKRSALPALLMGGVGVIALGTGVGLYVVSTGKYDEAERLHAEIVADTKNANHCTEGKTPNPKCAALKSAAEQSDALYAPGVALTLGGALLTAAGGAYLGLILASPSSPPKTGSRPTVTAIAVRGSGFVVQGTF